MEISTVDSTGSTPARPLRLEMCGGSATASSPHPGQVVRAEVLRPLGLSLTKAAQILGVRRATLSDLANGRTAVSAEMALRLEKAFGVSMDLLLRMQAGYDAAQARRRAAEINVRRYRPNLVPATD